MKCSEHFLEKIPLHLPIHGKHSASLQWGLSETHLQSQLGTAAAAFPPFQAKRPWGPVGWGWGFRWAFSRVSTPLRASVGFGKGESLADGALLRRSAVRQLGGCWGAPWAGQPGGASCIPPPPSLAGSGVATAPCPGVGSEGTKGWGGPGGAGQGGHPGGGSARTSSIVPPPLVAQAPSRGQRVSFLSQLGRAGSPPAFLFVFHPTAPRQPGPRPSKPREPHPALWDGAGLGGQLGTPLFVALGGHVGRRRDG